LLVCFARFSTLQADVAQTPTATDGAHESQGENIKETTSLISENRGMKQPKGNQLISFVVFSFSQVASKIKNIMVQIPSTQVTHVPTLRHLF
jgi:hypothetical protein